MDGEAMINSIQNGDHSLPVVTQVSLAGTTLNAFPTLKDPNNETAKDLWDALERQMRSSEYGEQDRKAAILYEYETFKDTEGEQLLDTYLHMVFMAKMEKVLSDSDESSSAAEKTITDVAYYTSESESDSEYETLKYYDKSTNYGLFVNDNDDQEIFHDAIEFASKNFIENHIDSQKDYDKSEVDHNDSEEKDHLVDKKKIDKQEILFDKMSHQLVEMNNNVLRLQEKIIEKETKILELEGCVSNKDVEIKKCLERLNDCENKLHKIGKTNQTIHMIMPSKDNLYNGRKGIEKIIIDLKDEVVSLLEKEKSNMEPIESLKSKGFELGENLISESENQSENDCQVVGKGCDQVENSKVIALGMLKLNVSQSVSPISVSKTSCASENVENKTKRKRRKRKSSKQNDKQVNNGVLCANRDFVHFSDLDTFSSVRRPKHSGIIWEKKGSSNTSNVDLSSVSDSKLNKDVKRYSRKDLLSCNNFHLGETSSAYVYNDAMNVSCNSRLYDSFNENNLFIIDDESVRNSQVSKMPFRKQPCDSLNVRSKSNSNKSLPRTVHRWLLKIQPLAEPVAKWILRVKR
nr:hypothetical protein [Tanacetum cinerariifolium]